MQKTLDEDAVLNGDIYGMIAPYATANFWVSVDSPRSQSVWTFNRISGGRTSASSTGGTTMRYPPTPAPRRPSRTPSP